jgi:S1-C subfamily serine protease
MDMEGNVVGMNTALISSSGSFAGVGFAIPIDTVRSIVGIINQKGTTSRISMGITIIGGDKGRSLFGLGPEQRGLVVLEVLPGSSAAEAGLRGISRSVFAPVSVGDIIRAVDGKRVQTEGDFLVAMDGVAKGDTVALSILRRLGSKSGSQEKYVELDLRVRLS